MTAPVSTQTLLARAIMAHNASDWVLANNLWSTLIDADPACKGAETATAYYNRGQVLHKIGDHEGAANDFRRVLHLYPTHPKAWHKYAAALLNMHADIPAMAAIEKSLDLDPMDAEAHHCYAGILSVMNDDAKSLTEWGVAHKLDPDRAETAIGQAMTMLRVSRGKDKAAWELFETRRAKGITDLYPGMPLWRGQPKFPISGRSILVRCEQGFGDTLQFVRYLKPLHAAGAAITLETPSALMRLMRTSLPEDIVLYEAVPGIPPKHDYQTALMTLPVAYSTWTDRPVEPYIHVKPEDAKPSRGFAVGLVWHGGARPLDPDANSIDGRRSIPEMVAQRFVHELEMVCPVVSLQESDLPKGSDFYDTACLIHSLDIVITVDTAVAHLAAGMGKPTWLLDRFSPCWRWGLGLDTTHWYPSMRIFRQATPGDWEPVMARVLDALKRTIDGTESESGMAVIGSAQAAD